MKKNKKGFFLAEAIVMIALVTVVMAYVFPNVTKLYENYHNKVKIYDQTEDIYVLKALYDAKKEDIDNETTDENAKLGCKKIKDENNNMIKEIVLSAEYKIGNIDKLYIADYMSTPINNNYNFNKYLKRLKKSSYDNTSYRLIGIFTEGDMERYASIKIENPNPDRDCNLGGE